MLYSRIVHLYQHWKFKIRVQALGLTLTLGDLLLLYSALDSVVILGAAKISIL